MSSGNGFDATSCFMGCFMSTLVLMMLVVAPTIGACSMNASDIMLLKQQAIELDLAHYNPKTGEWEWKKPLTVKAEKPTE